MNKSKKAQIFTAAAAVVLVAAVIAAALLTSGTGGEEAVLNKMYKAMYTTEGGGMPALIECIVPSQQQTYYDELTMGGTSFNQLAMWQSEASALVGGDVELEVSILQVDDDSASDLNVMRNTYGSNVQGYHLVAFRLDMRGLEGETALAGVLPMLLVDGQWYVMELDAGFRTIIEE